MRGPKFPPASKVRSNNTEFEKQMQYVRIVYRGPLHKFSQVYLLICFCHQLLIAGCDNDMQVLKDGTFVRTAQSDKLSYLVMSSVRANIVWSDAAQPLAQAVTIAIRYSCVRHQSELQPGLVALSRVWRIASNFNRDERWVNSRLLLLYSIPWIS
jgi:hypothetical protein